MKKTRIQRENNEIKEEFEGKYKRIMEDSRVNQMKLKEVTEEKNNLLKFIKESEKNVKNEKNEKNVKNEKNEKNAKNEKNENKENLINLNNNSGFFKEEASLKLKINRRVPGEDARNEMSFEDNLENLELTSKGL